MVIEQWRNALQHQTPALFARLQTTSTRHSQDQTPSPSTRSPTCNSLSLRLVQNIGQVTLAVRDLINQIKTSKDPNYCVRVTANDGAIGEQSLRDFQDNDKTIPTILTTSQKLSTGVDARNVRNIVLMRPINSMIEFKQIIGRGTRLFEGKDYFTIYDFVKAYEHFNDPAWDGEPVEQEPPASTGGGTGEPRGTRGGEAGGDDPPPRPQKVKIKLADGKEAQHSAYDCDNLHQYGWQADVCGSVCRATVW